MGVVDAESHPIKAAMKNGTSTPFCRRCSVWRSVQLQFLEQVAARL
jgi:hypothetical protein